MSKTLDPQTAKPTGDLVLQEVWRAKDTLSAQYGHDLDKLFPETHKGEQPLHWHLFTLRHRDRLFVDRVGHFRLQQPPTSVGAAPSRGTIKEARTDVRLAGRLRRPWGAETRWTSPCCHPAGSGDPAYILSARCPHRPVYGESPLPVGPAQEL